MEDRQVSKDFKASELWCKHCKAEGIKEEFVAVLQDFRDFLGAPVVITSGYRCAQHPVERGKKPGTVARHVLGVAVDMYCPSMSLEQFYSKIREFGRFQGIGVSLPSGFIHCDIRTAPAFWCYSSTGKTLPWNGEWSSLN